MSQAIGFLYSSLGKLVQALPRIIESGHRDESPPACRQRTVSSELDGGVRSASGVRINSRAASVPPKLPHLAPKGSQVDIILIVLPLEACDFRYCFRVESNNFWADLADASSGLVTNIVVKGKGLFLLGLPQAADDALLSSCILDTVSCIVRGNLMEKAMDCQWYFARRVGSESGEKDFERASERRRFFFPILRTVTS